MTLEGSSTDIVLYVMWADDDCFVCKYEEVTAAMPNCGDTFIIIT